MGLTSIIAVYVAVYVMLIDIGYYMRLPHYSRKVRLRTGRTFKDQCNDWYRMSTKLILMVNATWISMTVLLLIFSLFIPINEISVRPKLVSVFQSKNQSITVVIADGRVFKLKYSEYYYLKGKHPGMFLVSDANFWGWKLSDSPKLTINDYVEELYELPIVSADGIS